MGIAVVLVLVLALWVRLALFGAGCSNMPTVDDECIIALQAKQIARGDFSLLMLAQPYMFPLEAYLMAPVIELLPRTAFGARIVAFSMGLLASLLGWLILRRWGGLRDTWPGVLLLLFGSPFLFILQFGMALPGYPSLILLSMLMIWLAQARIELPSVPWAGALLVGFLGGLCCSVTMLALPVLLMAGAMIGLNRNWLIARWTVPMFAAGTVIGYIPHWLARYFYENRGGDILRMESWRAALDSLVAPTLTYTLPAALGMGCPVVPGSHDRIDVPQEFMVAYGVLGLLVLVAASLKALWVGWARWRRDRWLTLDAGLVFAGVSWICLIMFLFSARSASHTYRYLTLIILAWPFLVGYLYCHSGRFGRWVVGVLTLLVLSVNIYNGFGVLKRWSDPAFSVQLKSHDLGGVIRYLDERGIRHAYSVYADAYRLTYATDERVICAQLYNERFPSWPLPYKTDLVDPATNVAYVLSMDSRFTSAGFERYLASAKVTYRVRECGAYKVYTDFVPEMADARQVAVSKADASHGAANMAERLNTPDVYWRSEGYLQQAGMWISVEWSEPAKVRHILINHGIFPQDCPDTVHVFTLQEGEWVRLPNPMAGLCVPFIFKNGHPVYGGEMTRIDLPAPVVATGLKLEIVTPRAGRAWTIYDIAIAP
jgi:hypothetical protein